MAQNLKRQANRKTDSKARVALFSDFADQFRRACANHSKFSI